MQRQAEMSSKENWGATWQGFLKSFLQSCHPPGVLPNCMSQSAALFIFVNIRWGFQSRAVEPILVNPGALKGVVNSKVHRSQGGQVWKITFDGNGIDKSFSAIRKTAVQVEGL